MDRVSQMAIIGTGLLGASVGLGLKAAGFRGRIAGVGRRPESVQEAIARGAIDEAAPDVPQAVAQSQLALVAVPLSQFDAVFKQIAQGDHEDLVITDVGSTKQEVLEAARRRLAQPQRFVGSHPMAGSEQQGPGAARADLCRNKPCILTPEPDTHAWALERVEALWTMLGMRLIRMPAQEHDRQTAVISHLPHAVSVLLVQVAAERGGWQIASTGFADTTRLASSNPPMRADILWANREEVAASLEAFRRRLDRFCDLLSRGDQEALLAMLQQTKQRRDQWLKRQGRFLEASAGEAPQPQNKPENNATASEHLA